MRLASRLGYGDGFLQVAERAVRLEEAGVEQFWVGEAYSFDAATRLGYLAARTHHAQLGAGIFPIYSRTPALLAQTAAGLDELSNGRAVLGLGASGPQVVEGFHGVVYDRPLLRTREIIEICRKVWRREILEYHGKAYTLPMPPDQGTGLAKALKLSTHPVRDQIPIYLASLGERSVELTAELADGWLPIFYWPERADTIWGEALRRGNAKRDPSLGALEIVAGGLLAIGDGLEAMRDHERPHLALYIGGMGARGKNFYNDLACQYGFEREAAEVQELYLSGRKQEAAACIPQAMLDGLSLIGSEAFVRERVEAHRAAGVTWLDVTPIGEDPYGDVRRVKKWIS